MSPIKISFIIQKLNFIKGNIRLHIKTPSFIVKYNSHSMVLQDLEKRTGLEIISLPIAIHIGRRIIIDETGKSSELLPASNHGTLWEAQWLLNILQILSSAINSQHVHAHVYACLLSVLFLTATAKCGKNLMEVYHG
jgi:hypothetical protein